MHYYSGRPLNVHSYIYNSCEALKSSKAHHFTYTCTGRNGSSLLQCMITTWDLHKDTIGVTLDVWPKERDWLHG